MSLITNKKIQNNFMNVLLPAIFKNAEYIIEYNEPDSTPDHKDYIVRIQSIKSKTDQHPELLEQVGKEFIFKASDKFVGDTTHALDLIMKTYRDHIEKDVDRLERL